MSSNTADFIIVGGGLTGCALASRLAALQPSSKILLFEAGKDASGNPRTKTPSGCFQLAGSELDWSYKTVPLKHTLDRVHENTAGKVLGGGSILNYGGWFRADPADYDAWAQVTGDDSWTYEKLLPYFRKTENYYDKTADPKIHGFDGPIHVTSVSASNERRRYGLREHIKDAYTELGVPPTADPSKSLLGIHEFEESWHQGHRQPSNLAYGLDRVTVVTEALVKKVALTDSSESSEPVATGVELADGRQFQAKHEVIICSGSFRSPQLLMLSGIGPAASLREHSIPVRVDISEVGQCLYDHFAHFQLFKVRNPSGPHTLGNPHWADPAFFAGLPTDWAVFERIPDAIMRAAIEQDNSQLDHDNADLQRRNSAVLNPTRPHTKQMAFYAPLLPGTPATGPLIATFVMLTAPASRGSVSLASADPLDAPVIDPNFYATATDRAALIHGTHRTLRALLGTKAGRETIQCEVPPPGMKSLSVLSTDEEIDARIRMTGANYKHAMGGNAMGKVVDTDFRVKGVHGLRVCDASVFPVGMGGLPMATLYALAERAAVVISGKEVGE